MLKSKKENEKMVINLASEGKTTREIDKQVHISLRTIWQILNKVNGDVNDEKGQRIKDISDYSRAFQMFHGVWPHEGVAI